MSRPGDFSEFEVEQRLLQRVFAHGGVAGMAVPQADHWIFKSGGLGNTQRPALFTLEAERCAFSTGGASSHAICGLIIF